MFFVVWYRFNVSKRQVYFAYSWAGMKLKRQWVSSSKRLLCFRGRRLAIFPQQSGVFAPLFRLFLPCMKTSNFVMALLAFCLCACVAQAANSVNQTVPEPTAFRVVEQDGDHRLWQRETYEQGPDGAIITHVHNVTELATGMNHLLNGAWVASTEDIEILPNGTAAATNGQHQAYFPGDIYSGVIKVVTPDGQSLQSRPLALSYDDGNNTVLIAVLTNSIGQVLGTNQVIYPNAFTGLKADLRFTFKKSGFEQDIVLQEQPPAPASLGLNPNTTRIQVLTEFFNTTDPQQTATPVNQRDGLADTTLTFGSMNMVRGKAFAIGSSAVKSAAVYKSWQNIQGRTFLVEELPFHSIQGQLEQLPLPVTGGTSTNSSGPLINKISAPRGLPPIRSAQLDTNALQVARADMKYKTGVVLDYYLVDGSVGNWSFVANATYWVDGDFSIGGTATFEGGTVVKLDSYGQIDAGSITCLTSPYRPAIFTSINDNSVGEALGSGSPNCGDVNTFLNLSSGVTLRNMRFCYGWEAITLADNVGVLDVWDSQFQDEEYCVIATDDNVGFHNVLVGQAYDPGIYAVIIYDSGTFTGENVSITTGYGGSDLVSCPSTPYLVNCLTVNGSNVSVNGGSYTSSPYPIFQTVGAGSYYLATNSPYRNAGTTNITSSLLTELRQKTTYPPVIYSNITISVNTNLSPQAQRDTDAPDLGYHYDPIDYIVDNVAVTNAALTITNGTVIAYCNFTNGISLRDGSSITSSGSPLYPNWFVHYSLVQEQSVILGATAFSSVLAVKPNHNSGVQPTGIFRFTKFASPAAGPGHLYDAQNSSSYTNLLVQDCEFYGGATTFGGSTNTVAFLRNNLLFRTVFSAANSPASSYLALTNNLFWGSSSISFVTSNSPSWYAYDNAFDSSSGISSGTQPLAGAAYNAYNNSSGLLYPTNANDLRSSSALAYKVSFLGSYYQPTNSALLHKGNPTADLVGLYHYTVTTNQVVESTNRVSIGYHYVATDSNGNLLDSNGDGIPDYLEDANGNGIFDAGDLGEWKVSPFGASGNGALQVFTPLK
jgi:hypothetical protein